MADRPNHFDHGGDQRCYYGTGRRPDPPRSHAGLIALLLLLFFGLNLASFLVLMRLYREDTEPVETTAPPETTDSWFGSNYDDSAILESKKNGRQLEREQVSEKLDASLATVSSNGETVTGLVLTEDGYLLIPGEILENAGALSVSLPDGQHYDADLVGRDAATDFAILKINAEGLTAVELADGTDVGVGDTIYSIDASDGHITQTRTFKTLAATDAEGDICRLLRTGLDLRKEQPAAALANKNGQIIALYPGGAAEADGLTQTRAAIPTAHVINVLNDLISYGAPGGQATLGMEVCVLSEAQQCYWNLPEGVAIERIGESSGAYAAGLRPGDLLIRIGDQEVRSVWDYLCALQQLEAGQKVEITFYADGAEQAVTAVADVAGQDEQPYFRHEEDPSILTQ